MPFPNYKHKFKVKSHFLGPVLRDLVRQVENKIMKPEERKESVSQPRIASEQLGCILLGLAGTLTLGLTPGLAILIVAELGVYNLSPNQSATKTIADHINTLDIPPLTKYGIYATATEVFIETDLEISQLNDVVRLLTKKIKSQVPTDKDGNLLTADTKEGVELFRKVKTNFVNAYKNASANILNAPEEEKPSSPFVAP